jgi:hypothetical protein
MKLSGVSTGKSARATQTRKPSDASSDFLDALTQENGCGLFCGCQGACRLRTKGLRQPFVCFAASIRASFFVQAWVSPHCGQRKGAPVQAGGNRSQASRSATISVETFLPVF